MTTAIIVASGSSQRMGFDKLMTDLNGLPVLRRSIDAFLNATSIDSLVIVCPQSRWQALGPLATTKPLTRVDGGDSRQASVHAGLDAVPASTRWVAIHDGARPLVSPDDIDRCVAAAHQHGAATLAHRATDTMMRGDPDGFSTAAVDRKDLWCMETPQVFKVDQLHLAALHAKGRGLDCTDEVSSLHAIGGRVKFVEPTSPNLKVTTPADLALAEALLKR